MYFQIFFERAAASSPPPAVFHISNWADIKLLQLYVNKLTLDTFKYMYFCVKRLKWGETLADVVFRDGFLQLFFGNNKHRATLSVHFNLDTIFCEF